MVLTVEPTCTAFEGNRRVASGTLTDVARAAKAVVDGNARASLLIFDDVTSRTIEVDFRGTERDVVDRIAAAARVDGAIGAASLEARNDEATVDAATNTPRGPGRPKLGVVAREVTLLPRHWDWLNTQPGGASVALRKLVEEARRTYAEQDRVRVAQESAYRFMSAMAGDETGFESASRALFAGDSAQFTASTTSWAVDVRAHARMLAQHAFTSVNIE